MDSDSSLAAFIASNPDARELKRALAVQMSWKKTQARSPKADPQSGIARRAEIKKTSRA